MQDLLDLVLSTDRKLADIGIDPSTETGAWLTGFRMRAHWLRRGWDIPFAVGVVATSTNEGNKRVEKPVYSARLAMSAKRETGPLGLDDALAALRRDMWAVLQRKSRRAA